MKKITLTLLLFLYFLNCNLLFSQDSISRSSPIQEVATYEFEIDRKHGDDYSTFSLQEDGALVLFQSNKFLKGGQQSFIFTLVDTNLKEVWSKAHTLDNNLDIIDYFREKNFFYFLLKKNNYDYTIMRLNLTDGSLVLIPHKEILNLSVSHFKVLNDIIFMGGKADNQPVVLRFDYKNEQAKVLASIQKEHIYLARIDLDTTLNKVVVILSGNYAKQKNVYINIYNESGKLERSENLPNNIDYQLLSFRPYLLNETEMTLLGTYSLNRNSKTQGFYSINIEGTEITKRFYDFVYLKNFFNYVDSAKRKKYVDKIVKKKKAGKNKRFVYDFFVKELRLIDEQLYFSAESYVPLFAQQNMRNPTLSGLSPYYVGRSRFSRFRNSNYPYSSRNSRQIPISYKFTNTIICAFSKKGALQWDNSFTLKEHESDLPLPFSEYQTNGDSLAIVHFHKDKLYHKQIYKDQLQEQELEKELYSDEIKVEVATHENETLDAWHASYFLMTGYENSRIEGNFKKKKIYYLRKIAYVTE
jgi:hypothetical protein